MGVLVNTSLVTAFLAGVVALLAPCCITVLLPAYLGSVFSQRRKVFFMTFVFLLGILLVFLPLGLGFGGLGALFSRLHDWIFVGGAVFLLILAASLFWGIHPRLPFHISPAPSKLDVPSIFLLGMFSGLATTCCAPVLAGVIALAILPGSAFWGALYALSYVLGMTVPLFVVAVFLDKVNLTSRLMLLNKTVRVLGREITLSNLLASLTFLTMGALVLFLVLTGRLTMGSSFQVTANLTLTKYIESMGAVAKAIPPVLFPSLVLLMLAAIILIAVRQRRGRSE